MVKVGINGFGRIGRNVFRAALNNPNVEIVAVNDLTDAATLAHLLKYDSVHGVLPVEVEAHENTLVVDGKEIKVLAERDPAALKWADYGVEIVVESTYSFHQARGRCETSGGRREKVIISAIYYKRRHHDCYGCKRRQIRCREAHCHLQRLLHDQLSGSVCQSAE